MSVIATIEVSADAFTLGAALSANPGIRVELERVVPMGSTFIPYFWAKNENLAEIEEVLQEETDVDTFQVVDAVESDALVRVEWTTDLDGLLDVMAETNATILDAVGDAGAWTFQLRFDDHDTLTAFYRRCVEEGVTFDLKDVHSPGVPADPVLGLDLTETQRETLQVALDAGYFEVPRRINLVDLAAELGVSDTAASQRLRRGIAALLARTLVETDRETSK